MAWQEILPYVALWIGMLLAIHLALREPARMRAWDVAKRLMFWIFMLLLALLLITLGPAIGLGISWLLDK